MAEKKILMDQEAVSYQGLFNLTELYRLIDKFIAERGFDKYERFNEEKVTPQGKDIDLLLEPSRQVSDYAKHKMKIRIFVKGLKEVEVEKDGIKVKLHQGKIKIEFSAMLVTDIEGKWENSPPFIVFRTLVDKYIYKGQSRFMEADLLQQTKHLKTLVKSFLNLHRY